MGVIGVLADGLPEAGVVFLQFLLVALLPRLQHLRFLENCTKISWWRPASGRGFEGDQDTTHPGRFRQIKPFLDMLRWDYGGVSILKPSGFSIDGYCLVDWVDWPEVKATTQCPLHQSSGLFGQQGAGEGGKKKVTPRGQLNATGCNWGTLRSSMAGKFRFRNEDLNGKIWEDHPKKNGEWSSNPYSNGKNIQ